MLRGILIFISSAILIICHFESAANLTVPVWEAQGESSGTTFLRHTVSQNSPRSTDARNTFPTIWFHFIDFCNILFYFFYEKYPEFLFVYTETHTKNNNEIFLQFFQLRETNFLDFYHNIWEKKINRLRNICFELRLVGLYKTG